MKILLLDIETSPNTAHVWGLWNVNVGINQITASGTTLCYAAKWLHSKEIIFDSVHKSKPKKMVERMHKLLSEADAVVHFNGKRFDIPTLNKEFLLHGLTPPSPYKQIDLLEVTKKQFRFPSNKLDYVSKVLGLGSKIHHKGHELWVGCMNGDNKDWKVMEKYNKQDVLLLEKLYDKLLPWIPNHPNYGLYIGKPVCTNCGSNKLQSRGKARTALSTYTRFQCQGCGKWCRDNKATRTETMRTI